MTLGELMGANVAVAVRPHAAMPLILQRSSSPRTITFDFLPRFKTFLQTHSFVNARVTANHFLTIIFPIEHILETELGMKNARGDSRPIGKSPAKGCRV
jgi:hypothetical protein